MSNEKNGISRKQFLRLSAAAGIGLTAGLGGYFWSRSRPAPKTLSDIPGEIAGAAAGRGHRIREGKFPPVTQTENTRVVIVGAGIAGLAAGRMLHKNGISDFMLLDLESTPGGNSASGKNEVTPYPWGAHYLPIPQTENTDLIEALYEWGVITGFSPAGLPSYDPYYLCFEPRERLKISGHWQMGLSPAIGVPDTDKKQIAAFKELCHEMENAVGEDGKPAFTLPLEDCSQDVKFTSLDQMTLAEFISERGWDSPFLKWYLNYCCRDDYGATIENTSAWAGIHYFASRAGTAANASDNALLTWPEGNGWLVNRLAEPFREKIRTDALAFRVEQTEQGAAISYFDFKSGLSHRISAEKVILCTPRFVSDRLFPRSKAIAGPPPQYAPWVVANITLSQRPGGNGAPLCWDNVCMDSPSLGYVVADHQTPRGFSPKKTVITWYHPVSDRSPDEARKWIYESDFEFWRHYIVEDLEFMHKGITQHIEHISVWKWGHGMISPQPGYLWHPERPLLKEPEGHVHFAHSDLSGISIFEEAFFQGNRAAREVIASLQS